MIIEFPGEKPRHIIAEGNNEQEMINSLVKMFERFTNADIRLCFGNEDGKALIDEIKTLSINPGDHPVLTSFANYIETSLSDNEKLEDSSD